MTVIALVVCADPIQLFGSRREDPLLLFKWHLLLFSSNTFSGIDDTLSMGYHRYFRVVVSLGLKFGQKDLGKSKSERVSLYR